MVNGRKRHGTCPGIIRLQIINPSEFFQKCSKSSQSMFYGSLRGYFREKFATRRLVHSKLLGAGYTPMSPQGRG